MKIFLLKAIEDCEDFEPWFDKTFGHVVRAENEGEARTLAAVYSRNEGAEAWINQSKTTCVDIELIIDGVEEHLMFDERMA